MTRRDPRAEVRAALDEYVRAFSARDASAIANGMLTAPWLLLGDEGPSLRMSQRLTSRTFAKSAGRWKIVTQIDHAPGRGPTCESCSSEKADHINRNSLSMTNPDTRRRKSPD